MANQTKTRNKPSKNVRNMTLNQAVANIRKMKPGDFGAKEIARVKTLSKKPSRIALLENTVKNVQALAAERSKNDRKEIAGLRTEVRELTAKLDALLKSPVEEVMEWVPKVGDYVVKMPIGGRVVNSLGCAIVVGTYPVLDVSTHNGKPCYGLVQKTDGDYLYTIADNLRPATPEEIATYEQEKEASRKAEQEASKLSKLKFGVKVSTKRGKGIYLSIDSFNKEAWVAIESEGKCSWLPLSDITIVGQ